MIPKIASFLKRHLLIILLAIIAVSLLILHFSAKKPTPVAPQTTTTKSLLEIPNIPGADIPSNATLEIKEFSFPAQLKTYEGKVNMLNPDQVKQIAKEFNFSEPGQESKDATLGRFYLWTTKDRALTVLGDVGKIDYGVSLYQLKVNQNGTLPPSADARKFLENLLDKLNLDYQFEKDWQKDEYLIQSHELELTYNLQDADLIRVGFNPKVNQYQLVNSITNEPIASLILDKKMEIISFRSQVYFNNFTDGANYDLKTQTEVQSSLSKEGKIVFAGNQNYIVEKLNFDKIQLNQISLAYYQDPEKNSLTQPIYVLSGQGTLADGSQTEIIAYLPAIASKYLNTTQQHFQIENFSLPTGGFNF